MPTKKRSKPKINVQQGQAASKAYIKKIRKAEQKLKLDLRKLEKALSNPLLAWHRG